MPPTLPKSVFIVGAFRKMVMITKLWLRYILVFLTWVVFVPFSTTQIWNLYFSHSYENSLSVGYFFFLFLFFFFFLIISNSIQFSSIVSDCFEGAIISASVIVLFLGIMALRDYVVSNTVLREQVLSFFFLSLFLNSWSSTLFFLKKNNRLQDLNKIGDLTQCKI